MKELLMTLLSVILLVTHIRCERRVLRPTKEGEPSGLILIAGAYLYNDQYEALGLEIQRQSKQSLWVCLSDNDLVESGLVSDDTYIARCVTAMRDEGLPENTRIVAAGHSYGAVLLFDEVSRYPDLVDGAAILGATLPDGSFGKTPIPVLVANGELDGQTRITQHMQSFQNVLDNANDGDGRYKLWYPHVVIEGVNHCEFTTGEKPERVLRYWINSDVSAEESRRLVASAVVPFVDYVTSSDNDTVAEASAVLESFFIDTATFMEPLLTAFTAEENVRDQTSAWAVASQTFLANTSGSALQNITITNEVVDEATFYDVQPTIVSYNDKTVIATFAHVDRPSFLIAGEYVGAYMLEVKQKSPQAIQDAAEHATSVNSSLCRHINELAFDWVWYTLTPETQRDRYLSRNITQQFLSDIVVQTEDLWLEQALSFDFNGAHLEVQSAVFATGTSDDPVAGMYHCKLLSPAKAIEFIYVDALYETFYEEST